MDTNQKFGLFFVLIILTACVVAVGNIFLNDYRHVDGHVVGHAYTAGQMATGSGVNVADSSPVQVTTYQAEKYTLMIEINGGVSSYDVSADLYARVLAGQTVVSMSCNDMLCAVSE